MKNCIFVLFFVINFSVRIVSADAPEDGYYLDELNEVGLGNLESDVLECPTDNVITTRYKCKVDGKWVDCTRKYCCKDYVYLAGKCIHKDQDPCSMGFCEQLCTVYLQRVICTCHEGYRFSPKNQKLGIKPVCVDLDECLDNNGDCQHNCVNQPGGYTCTCRDGFLLRGDNRTCYPQEGGNVGPSHADEHEETQAGQREANRDHCYANCDTVSRLHDRLKALQEKVSALSTAIKLSTMASGPPGPAGPPGPPGPQGPRGFTGTTGTSSGIPGSQDYTYTLLDGGFVPLQSESEAYCRCKRGPQGEIGATGIRGPKGDKGTRGPRGPQGKAGSIDILLLLLADIRYDVVHLQNKVYANGEKPPKYDFQAILQNKSQKDKARLQKQQQLLQGYVSPAVESSAAGHRLVDTVESPPSPTEEAAVEEFRDNVYFITDNDDYYEEETSALNDLNNEYYYENT